MTFFNRYDGFPEVPAFINEQALAKEPLWPDLLAEAQALSYQVDTLAYEPEMSRLAVYAATLQRIIQNSIDQSEWDAANANEWRIPGAVDNILQVTKTYLTDLGPRFETAKAEAQRRAAATSATLPTAPVGPPIVSEGPRFQPGNDFVPPAATVIQTSAEIPPVVQVTLVGPAPVQVPPAPASSSSLGKLALFGLGAWLLSRAFSSRSV